MRSTLYYWLGHWSLHLSGALVLFVIGACASDFESNNIEVLNLSNIVLQESQERSWLELEFQESLRLPVEFADSLTFFSPGAVRSDSYGNVYVVDFGIPAIHGFDSTGHYIATYGQGAGRGPGELMTIIDMGVKGDSVVYVADNHARKISYFSLNGEFLRSEPVGFAPARFRIASNGRSYTMVGTGEEYLFESKRGRDLITFGAVTGGPIGSENSVALGMIATFKDKLIYAPTDFPVVILYEPDGTIKYARGTPDWGKVEIPEWESIDLPGGGVGYRTTGQSIHGEVSVDEDKAYVIVNMASGEAVDVYDVSTGDYEHSFQLPTQIRTSFLLNSRIYGIEADTTAVVYSME
ncbi:MAG: 6-bladed beta-propeller [Bacteroidetes bacterium]|nr:6-bladed beta-propeller [Bacteroidota bacterium]